VTNLTSRFKSKNGEAEYMAAYDRLLQLWPVPYEPMDITNRFGRTHLVACGPKGGPALVLLHGYLATLNMWLPNIADLSKDYRVYALDVMGQPGKSIPDQSAPIRSRADFVAWLTATLDALQVDRAHLMGMSYGGWLTLNYAIAAPERLTKIALLSPAGSFLRNTRRFTVRAMAAVFFPKRFVVESFVHWLTYKQNLGDPEIHRLDKLMVDLMHLGMKHFRMQAETLGVEPLPFSDDELHALQVPALLLIGQQEVIYDPALALGRAQQLIPNLQAELVPRASHDMSYGQHEVVDALVLKHFAMDVRSKVERERAA
jgi:pimeloyl-ACP methyl ester carboxylesterase